MACWRRTAELRLRRGPSSGVLRARLQITAQAEDRKGRKPGRAIGQYGTMFKYCIALNLLKDLLIDASPGF